MFHIGGFIVGARTVLNNFDLDEIMRMLFQDNIFYLKPNSSPATSLLYIYKSILKSLGKIGIYFNMAGV